MLKKKRLTKLITISLILYPILHIYGVHNFDFSLIAFVLLFACSALIYRKVELVYPPFFIYFALYIILTRAIFSDNLSLTSVFSFGFILFVLSIGFYCKEFDLDYGLKIYRIVAIANALFFIFQECTYSLTGIRILGILTFLPINLEMDTFDYVAKMESLSRSSAFFSEPANLVQYILPLFAIELFTDKKSYFRLFLLLYVLIMSQSGNAVLGLAVIFAIWLIFIGKRVSIAKMVLICASLLFILVGVGAKFLNSDMGDAMLERTSELENSEMASSGFIRIYRGYFVYDELNTIEKIVGINNPNKVVSAINSSSVSWSFEENDTYFNLIQEVLINGGLISLIIIVLCMSCLWTSNSLSGKTIVSIFFALSFIAALYLSSFMLLYLTLSYLMWIRSSNRKQKSICCGNCFRLSY